MSKDWGSKPTTSRLMDYGHVSNSMPLLTPSDSHGKGYTNGFGISETWIRKSHPKSVISHQFRDLATSREKTSETQSTRDAWVRHRKQWDQSSKRFAKRSLIQSHLSDSRLDAPHLEKSRLATNPRLEFLVPKITPRNLALHKNVLGINERGLIFQMAYVAAQQIRVGWIRLLRDAAYAV